MDLKNYLFPSEERHFEVVCKDATMHDRDLTHGAIYKVLGALQGFFIMMNNRKVLGKYYRDRFVLKEDDE